MRAILALIAAGALVLAGCGDDGESDAAGAAVPTTVEIVDGRYDPEKVRVLVGEAVTWVNLDGGVLHTAQTKSREDGGWREEEDFDTHTLTWEEPYTVTFHKPGTFAYYCSFHPSMKGTVEVATRPLPPE